MIFFRPGKMSVIGLLGVLWSAQLFAQDFWRQTNGPIGGDVRSLAVSGSSIFAGTVSGIFRSTNNGASWSHVGLENDYVYCFAVNGRNVFAGTEGSGVLLSTDDGGSWTTVNNGFGKSYIVVSALAVSGTNLFAGVGGSGVFVSTNNGSSWNQTGLTNTTILAFAISGSSIFAASDTGGVFRSTNNGGTWAQFNSGLSIKRICSLAAIGANIFAGTYGNGVFLSTNSGSSWTPVNTGLTNGYPSALAVLGSNLYAGTNGGGVYLSTNNGSSWTSVNLGLWQTSVSSLLANGTSLYAGTLGSGVFRSTDGATTWTQAVVGMNGATVFSISASDTSLCAGTDGGGVHISKDHGTTWNQIGMIHGSVSALALSGGFLVAGTNGSGVFVTSNNGQQWAGRGSGLTNTSVNSLAVVDANVFAGTGGGGIFISTDNGTSWAQRNSGLTNLVVRSLAVSGTKLFAGTYGGGVFVSTDKGSTWSEANTGLSWNRINALAIDGANIFAGTEGGAGVYVSTDKGSSWAAANTGLTNNNVQAIALSRSSSGTGGRNLYAGTEGSGVFFSSNNGANWVSLNAGLPSTDVRSLAINAAGYVLAGTRGGGVFRGVDSTPKSLSLLGEYSADANTVLLLHMNETTGSAVADASTPANNGTARGTTIVVGRFGKARLFVPNENVSVLPSATLSFSGDFTIETWVRTLTPGPTDPLCFVYKWEGNETGPGFKMATEVPSGHLYFGFGDLNGGSLDQFLSTSRVDDGQWHHVAVTRGGNTFQLFIDGIFDGSLISSKGSLANSSALSLGNFNGSLDEVRVSNRTRAPQEFDLQLPPMNLTSVGSGTTINLTWQNGGGAVPLMRYKIYRGADSTNVSLIDSTSTPSYANSGLKSGARYFYRVSAVDSTGFEGAKSHAAAATPYPSNLVQVAGGTFQMGTTTGDNATLVHTVTVGTFYIDRTEVTYEKWTDVRNWGLTHGYPDLGAGGNGYSGAGVNQPATQGNWCDMLKWCNARSEKDGLTPVYYTSNTLTTVYRAGQLDLSADAVKWTANGYRLPTEAEWEFAARGGTKSQGRPYSGSDTIDAVAWISTNSGNNTHPVSTKAANELGLYDMSGNVWEWCWDWYAAYSVSIQTDPKGPASGTNRVQRGGSFEVSGGGLEYCHVAVRFNRNPYDRDRNTGFRCVQGDAAMVFVAGGTFQMGSTTGSSDETPVHSVTLGAFNIDKTEITYEKWTDVQNWGLTHGYTDLVAGRNGFNGATNHPVTEIKYHDILKWCNARSEKDGLTPVYFTSNSFSTVYHTGRIDLAADAVKWTANGYRLPTEAEWEFAARGGTKSKGCIYSGSDTIEAVAWDSLSSGHNTHPVSTKAANELGLYDMSGNVWEWCWDWYGGYSSAPQTDPKGPASGTYRLWRGGSFNLIDRQCRVAYRGFPEPISSSSDVGFRCVQTESAPIDQFPPTASTMSVSSVSSNSATVGGSVNPNGLATTAYFEWGTSSTLSTSSATATQSIGSGSSAVSLVANLSGLSPNTTYYYRVVGQNRAGVQKGAITSFRTTAGVLGEYSPDANTVLLLHMNETSGSTVSDASSYGNDGTANGTTVVNGRLGKARSWNSSGEQIDVPHSEALNFGTGSYTIEAWLNTLGFPPSGAPHHKRGVPPSMRGWITGLNQTGEPVFAVYNNPAFSGEAGNSGLGGGIRKISDGKWHHLAVAVSQTTLQLYVDGVLDQSAGVEFPGSADNEGILYLGFQGGAPFPFRGLMDEVRISNIARSPEQFNLQLPPKNLTAVASGTTTSITWQNGGGAVPMLRYRIYRGSDSTNVSLIDSTSSTGFNDRGVSLGTRYYYKVSAVDVTGFEGAQSSSTGVTVVGDLSVVAFYPFSGNANDGSGNGNNGINHGATLATDRFGNANSSYAFDGVNSYIDGDKLLTTVQDNFAVSIWIKPTQPHEIDAESVVGGIGTEGQKYVIFPTHGTGFGIGQAGMGISAGTNGVSVYEHAAEYMPVLLSYSGPISGWTHVVVVYKNKQPTLFLNGSLVRTGLTSSYIVHPSIGKAGVYPNHVGGFGGGTYGYFNGQLDDIRIYSRTLSAAEIDTLYHEGGWPLGSPDLIQVVGGTFQMGSTTGNADETPAHPVALSAFYIDKTEITYEKWTDVRNWGLTHGYSDLVAGRNGYTGTTNHPVIEVNWYDILKWCNARSEKDGSTPVYYASNTLSTVYRTGELDLAADAVKWTANGYRLPTESEWEFAARGGTKSRGYIYSGSSMIDSVAWCLSNSGNNTHPVSTKGANELGLYDMSGNVWEWCWDWYGAYSNAAQTDPKGPVSGIWRVLRGGHFGDVDDGCRATWRYIFNFAPVNRGGVNGFRCVQSVTAPVAQLPPSVSTTAASAVSSNSATVSGSVNPNGLAATAYFEWGTSSTLSTFSATASQSIVSGTSAVGITASLTGLIPNTTYYYLAVGQNSAGMQKGAILSFTASLPLPAITVLSSPLDGASGTSVSPVLTWSQVVGSETYHLQVSTSVTFVTLALDDSTLTSTSRQLMTLSNETRYYWRVQARNSAGYGPYSLTWSFTTITAAPSSAVICASPAQGATGIVVFPVLSWLSVPRGSSYHVQLSTLSGFSTSVFDDTTIVDTARQVGPLQTNTLYFWRVRAKNDGGYGPYSAIWSFATNTGGQPAAPPALSVQLLSPANQAQKVPVDPRLSWSQLLDATKYQLQVSTSPIFVSRIFDDTTLVQTSQQIGMLQNNTTLYWRVRGKNGAGDGPYSQTWSFTTIVALPSTASLSSPLNSAVSVPITPTCTWGALAAATSYHLQVSTTSSFTTAILDDTTLTATSRQLTGIQNSALYYWRVRGKNDAGYGPFSSSWSFTTIVAAPSAVNLVSPTNAQAGVLTSPTLSWSSIPEASGYHLQVSANSSFAPFLLDDTILSATTKRLSPLQNNTIYYWRVRAKNEGGYGSYSPPWSFTTIPAYTPTVPLSTSLTFATKAKANEYTALEYRLIGLPGSSDIFAKDIVSGIQNEDWEIVWDNGAASSYLKRYDGSADFKFSAGKAFWIISKNPLSITRTVPSAPLNAIQEAEIAVRSGWNLITNPFDKSIPWTRIQTTNGIMGSIYSFNGAFNNSATFDPYAGYYFFNGTPSPVLNTLRVPFSSAFGKLTEFEQRAESGWRMYIEVSTGGRTSDVRCETEKQVGETRDVGRETIEIGVEREAKDGLDGYDQRMPRRLEKSGLYFDRPEWDNTYVEFGRDIKAETNHLKKWEFTVQGKLFDERTITAKGVQSILQTEDVFLVDKERGVTVNLKQKNEYTFGMVKGKMSFEILIGKRETIDEEMEKLLPTETSVGPNYPNPFNPETFIPVRLPAATDITIMVYDILGRQVRLLYGGVLTKGVHWLKWDGKDDRQHAVSSGVYFYRALIDNHKMLQGKMLVTR
ncbi:MAG: SUMF1/EgtB/PvdO family nonheme iron enzyme [Ignavibacteriales bacterium]|nr:SUMF1/EgtB/PvdO family nonheme iron enzyme [Ignavibacteriales bacterium]